jgi:peptidoglycan/LPS O-acetylase OafA/YrhL
MISFFILTCFRFIFKNNFEEIVSMKDKTEVKIAAGVLAIYGLAILGYLGWLVNKAGLMEPLQVGGTAIIGIAFLVGGLASFQMKEWGLYVTAVSIIGTIGLAVTTALIPGGALPTLLMIAILWDIYKHKDIME